jgi:plasmid maintenance system antidote protein VapI
MRRIVVQMGQMEITPTSRLNMQRRMHLWQAMNNPKEWVRIEGAKPLAAA